MIKRIVKMEFSPKDSKIFINIFNDNKKNILNFEGCKSIILLQDINNDNIFFTYSFWKSEYSLKKYKESETFKVIWQKIKVLFSNKPLAWSVKEI